MMSVMGLEPVDLEYDKLENGHGDRGQISEQQHFFSFLFIVLRVFSILLSFEKGLTLPVLLIAIAFPWSICQSG